MTNLDLSDNQLIDLPKEAGEWKNLETLDLSNNQLTSLPPEIANLKHRLQTLKLGNNNISEEERAKIKSYLPNTHIFF